ncbi:unnamed protein product [Brachionus calyciflorus]|uniref:Endonuclease-reverse transcriptase n=1 Tax=Brachionus calyciflorus TaxID=104777 RepID=A0A814HCK2_9BILA|nr:unnamed protein product [Brachionus calyciflorus]
MVKSSGLQNDLDIIINWSKIWSSDLNLLKCKSMSICRKDQTEYEVFNRVDNTSYLLQRTDEERDLAVYTTSDLKWRKHCTIAASKANRALGQIRNIFCYLEHNTTLKGDIELIEKVQKRATKLVKSVRNLPYQERLKKLGMLRLEDRRVRGDLIQIFKIINGCEDINLTNSINYSISNTRNLRRGHDKRLVKEIVKRGSYRYNFLTNRVVNHWNELPYKAVYARSVGSLCWAIRYL